MTSIYWPGTKIVKSRGNAFDWQSDPRSEIVNNQSFVASARAKRNSRGSGTDPRKQFTIYSKAHPKA
jgi:hypothetical protein